ncbi:hypothetical protein U876_07010 [Aeromonas hydrophila NJ-35]|nr:hypothetical protein V469_07030 [Aeromonas hydrophila J-1]AKJ37002.1 hypothetical protein U876_07010 [Aeromonas hydrophila NJ-35]ANR99379.1 hypothetical protein A9258_06995 [Aeromonas hydrophila]
MESIIRKAAFYLVIFGLHGLLLSKRYTYLVPIKLHGHQLLDLGMKIGIGIAKPLLMDINID